MDLDGVGVHDFGSGLGASMVTLDYFLPKRHLWRWPLNFEATMVVVPINLFIVIVRPILMTLDFKASLLAEFERQLRLIVSELVKR